MDYLSAIEKAFLDYADWISKKSVLDLNSLAKPTELRGIFFNKLVTRLREIGVNIGNIRKVLYPTDLSCIFVSPGYITKVSIAYSAYNYSYHAPERKEVLRSLGEAFAQIDMTILSNRFNWELTKIVNSLKSL